MRDYVLHRLVASSFVAVLGLLLIHGRMSDPDYTHLDFDGEVKRVTNQWALTIPTDYRAKAALA